MCSVSVIQNYGRERINPAAWTRDSWSDYQEILRRLAALDTKLNQPDCEDPAKAEWMADIEQRLDALEQKN